MAVKDQLNKLKENWLIIVLVLALLFISPIASLFSSIGGGFGSTGSKMMFQKSIGMPSIAYESSSSYRGSNLDFAPEVEARVILKDSSLTTEVKRGAFQDSESKLKSIITSSGAYLLSENVNKYGEGLGSYYNGYYTIKVDSKKYDAVLEQLKGIGEVKSFYVNAVDVTGAYTNLQTELGAEKTRLERYESMYNEAESVSDKLTLSDRIFDQERRIKYLEESIANIDQRVDYSQISFTMTEAKSGYANMALVKLSDLVKTLVGSFNALLVLLFFILPWAIVILIVRFFVRKGKKKK